MKLLDETIQDWIKKYPDFCSNNTMSLEDKEKALKELCIEYAHYVLMDSSCSNELENNIIDNG